MTDGDINYSKYTLRELEEALAGINKHQYPKNYANLRCAYERESGAAVSLPDSEEPVAESAPQDAPTAWDRFWSSRPIAGIGGLFCLWWSIELFTGTDSCTSGHRALALITNSVCKHFGPQFAAIIPLGLGLASLVYAVAPRRPAGAKAGP